MRLIGYTSSRVAGPMSHLLDIKSIDDLQDWCGRITSANSASLKRPDGQTLTLIIGGDMLIRTHNKRHEVVAWINGGEHPFPEEL